MITLDEIAPHVPASVRQLASALQREEEEVRAAVEAYVADGSITMLYGGVSGRRTAIWTLTRYMRRNRERRRMTTNESYRAKLGEAVDVDVIFASGIYGGRKRRVRGVLNVTITREGDLALEGRNDNGEMGTIFIRARGTWVGYAVVREGDE